MAKAFKCDKCGEFIDGERRGKALVYATNEDEFEEWDKTKATEVDLCSACFGDVAKFCVTRSL
jgi:hypothetical protein